MIETIPTCIKCGGWIDGNPKIANYIKYQSTWHAECLTKHENDLFNKYHPSKERCTGCGSVVLYGEQYYRKDDQILCMNCYIPEPPEDEEEEQMLSPYSQKCRSCKCQIAKNDPIAEWDFRRYKWTVCKRCDDELQEREYNRMLGECENDYPDRDEHIPDSDHEGYNHDDPY